MTFYSLNICSYKSNCLILTEYVEINSKTHTLKVVLPGVRYLTRLSSSLALLIDNACVNSSIFCATDILERATWQPYLNVLYSIAQSLPSPFGAVYKGRQQRLGRGGWSHADRGVKDLVDVCKLVLFFIVSACFADTLSLWMMPIKVQIVIHLIRFAPQSIIWAGTKACIQLTLRVRLLIT